MTKPKNVVSPCATHPKDNTAPNAKTRKRSLRKRTASPSESQDGRATHPSPETTAPPTTPAASPTSPDDLDDALPTPQCVIDAYNDDEREDRIGYKNPPKSGQFKKGQSGNPSGKRRKLDPPPGNRLQSIGDEVLDMMTILLEAKVEDLQVKQDDLVTTAMAKCLIGDGLKKNGDARKLMIAHFIEKPLQSERFLPKDPGVMEAEIMQTLVNAIVDPTLTEKEYDRILQHVADYRASYGGLGPLKPPRKKKRRPPRRLN